MYFYNLSFILLLLLQRKALVLLLALGVDEQMQASSTQMVVECHLSCQLGTRQLLLTHADVSLIATYKVKAM